MTPDGSAQAETGERADVRRDRELAAAPFEERAERLALEPWTPPPRRA